MWIQDYPQDFAGVLAADALDALVKYLVSKTHLLHRVPSLQLFVEGRPLQDKDVAWALKIDDPTAEDDGPCSFSEDDGDVVPKFKAGTSQIQVSKDASSTQSLGSGREPKPSPPLRQRDGGTTTSEHVDSAKEMRNRLLSTSAALSDFEPQHVAEEITRVWKTHFLLIEVRTLTFFGGAGVYVLFIPSLGTG